jgi:aconitase A
MQIGIEAEAVILGAPISLVLPQVVGYRLTGEMNQYVTSTDVVLTITKVSCFIFICYKDFKGKGTQNVSKLFPLFDKEG